MDYLTEIRQNIDPYPLASEVKLLWDRQERIGVIMPMEDGDVIPGTPFIKRIGKGADSYVTHVVTTPYGDTMQAVYWQGEGTGFWSPEYLLPADFDFSKRPAVTISRHSMYVIEYVTDSGIVSKEGFMFISSDDDQDVPWE